MTSLSLLLLLLSISLSAGRNLLSKNISSAPFGTRSFFTFQSLLFFSGAGLLLLLGGAVPSLPSGTTLLLAFLYGAFLICAQWCYTMALQHGNTAICATVYSLGFIFPTLSGMLFWHETVTVFKYLGILVAVLTILVSGLIRQSEASNGPKTVRTFPLIAAMLSSGALGILQKVQQSGAYAHQRSEFLLLAFLLAGGVSLTFRIFCASSTERPAQSKLFSACGIGVCFGSCNLLNTILAGRLDSAVFFPVLNIGTILLSTLLGMLLFHERFGTKQRLILPLGILSILLINFTL